MKGAIEALKFEQDRKGQVYAVATVEGEDVYTWDAKLMDMLKALRQGSVISYELADRGDFKFRKFASLDVVEEAPKPHPFGFRDDHIRIPGLSEMKFRSKALEIAAMQVESSGLKDPDKKRQKTLELYRDYMGGTEEGYEGMFNGIRHLDED